MKKPILKFACYGLAALMSTPVFADTYTYTNSDGQLIECTRAPADSGREGHPVLGTLAGGAVGGLVGNQFGKGKGKTAMTAAGVVGGAVAGHRIAEGKQQPANTEEQCHPVENRNP